MGLKAAGMSMPKAGLLPEEEKKKAIEESLEWLRNNDLDVEDVDGPTVKTLSKLAGIPLPRKLTDKNKKKTMDNAVNWLRNAESEDLQPIDNGDLECLTKLAGVPMPGISDIDKARALNDALEWLRKNDPDVEDVDKATLKSLAKLSGVSMPKKLTPEAKKKALDDALNWLRGNDVTL